MRDLLQGVKDMVEAQELVDIDSPEVEASEGFPEDWTEEDEDRFNGGEAGVVFAQRHVMDKVNLFIEEYRRNNYSEAFIQGFLDGINGAIGSNINMNADEESDSEAVDSSN